MSSQPCPICQIAYGLENPRCEEIAGTRNFLAVLDKSTGSQRVLILPKRPEISLTDIANPSNKDIEYY